jgi:hypothetical protein
MNDTFKVITQGVLKAKTPDSIGDFAHSMIFAPMTAINSESLK